MFENLTAFYVEFFLRPPSCGFHLPRWEKKTGKIAAPTRGTAASSRGETVLVSASERQLPAATYIYLYRRRWKTYLLLDT